MQEQGRQGSSEKSRESSRERSKRRNSGATKRRIRKRPKRRNRRSSRRRNKGRGQAGREVSKEGVVNEVAAGAAIIFAWRRAGDGKQNSLSCNSGYASVKSSCCQSQSPAILAADKASKASQQRSTQRTVGCTEGCTVGSYRYVATTDGQRASCLMTCYSLIHRSPTLLNTLALTPFPPNPLSYTSLPCLHHSIYHIPRIALIALLLQHSCSNIYIMQPD